MCSLLIRSLSYFLIVLHALLIYGCCPYRYMPNPIPPPLPPVYVPERVRVALVLGSGGVRGMAHVGVLEELEAAGIPIDLIVGCSAGSIVGALYADNPNAAAIKSGVWRIKTDSFFDIDLLNCRYGLSQGHTLRKVLNKYLTAKTFEQLKIPLVVVASDLYSGELIPMGSGDLIKAVQASYSIPFVFVPCEHMGRVLVDGGIINPVPVKVAWDLNAEVIIAVDLCELLPQTFPNNLFQVVTRSAEIALMWQNEACTRKADVVIRPKTCGVGTFNDRVKMQICEAGRLATREKIPQIKELITSLSIRKENNRRHYHYLSSYAPQITQSEEEEPELIAIQEE